MAARLIDERGNRYGRLVVVSHVGADATGSAVWLCRCDCGGATEVRGAHLRRGNTHSCGCGPRGGMAPHYGETPTLINQRRRSARRRLVRGLTSDS